MYQSLGTRQTPQQKGKDMSTEGLKGIDALRKGLHEHAREVKAKAQETLDEINETNRQKAADLEAADIMRRRLEQEADDRLEELDHVAGQRAYIAFGVRSDEPDVPAEPEPPAPAPTPEPEPDPAPNDDNADNGDHTRVDTPPVQASAAATANGGNTVVVVSHFNPRHWRGGVRFFSFVGAIVGLILSLNWYPFSTGGVQHDVSETFWVIGWIVFLAYLFGLIAELVLQLWGNPQEERQAA